MTSQPSRLGSAAYELESSWGEPTDTFGTRLELHGEPIVPSDIQDRIVEPVTFQRLNEGKRGVLGPWKESGFTITGALTGHGAAPTGALTATDLYDLIFNSIGGGSTAGVGGTVAVAPTSANEFVVTGGTQESGGMVRVGTLGDNRGNGQFVVVDDAGTTTLLTDLDATPNSADVVYSAQIVHPLENTNSGTIASTRWLLQTRNGQWKARGCYPTSITLSQLGTGEAPTYSIEFGVSIWEDGVNETFPSVTATDAKDSTICAAGSLFLNDVGTATRSTECYRSWSMTISLGVAATRGPCGLNQYQVITNARRLGVSAEFEVMLDAEATGTTTWADKFEAGTFQHALFTLSPVAGKAIGVYFPQAEIVMRPTQESSDSLNRVNLKFRAMTGPDSTTDLTASAFRLAMG